MAAATGTTVTSAEAGKAGAGKSAATTTAATVAAGTAAIAAMVTDMAIVATEPEPSRIVGRLHARMA